MTPKIPLSLMTLPGQATYIGFLRLKSSDLVIIGAIGCITLVILWCIVNTFITTLMPTPALPMFVNGSLSTYRLFKNYQEVITVVSKYVNMTVAY
ncbi:MAG: hypothetical protein P5702_16385 [Limnospira sp. PMC 1291.21]|uniref:Uncharacterized protein n=2 Tax=Limnospira TaxID=2596745 RepID=A0A9P1KGC2_9CYAN|nr:MULTISPECIES: hypothetical protein [Limnospira]MBD2671740.1 hypothetical protein [Arthrospira platensis FACHB-439]MDC0838860.1 hypothetical protein [Limnoraphis robusta]MDY7053682.1 hypothetical protein [Limnospira fusiformis LS22]QJB25733.1 hypothetical protein HFV01_07960 [Limnospira fusiformis SAG 85.79]UWU47624.1 hypothetical protein APLC1_2395 [Arthrospira platensis C1]